MPNKVLKTMSKEHHVSFKTIEKYWKAAKEAAIKKGLAGVSKYKYAMSIVKRRLGDKVGASVIMEVIASVESVELARPNSIHNIVLTNAGRIWTNTHLINDVVENQELNKPGTEITMEGNEFSVTLIYPKSFTVNNYIVTEKYKSVRKVEKVGKIVLGATRINMFNLAGRPIRSLPVPICGTVLLQTDNSRHQQSLIDSVGL